MSDSPELPDSPDFQPLEPSPPANPPDAERLIVEATPPAGARQWWRRPWPTWHAGGINARPLTLRQKLWRAGGILLTLAALTLLFGEQIASLATSAWNTAFPRPPAPVVTCLADASWSPSGNRLAVLGYAGRCGDSPRHVAGVLNIYDGAGRRRLRQIALDPLLASAFATQARAVDTDRIALGQVLWIINGKRLAITFSLPPRSDIGQTTTQFGLLTLDPSSATVRPQVQFEEIPNQRGSSYPPPGLSLLWDLVAGQNSVLDGQSQFLPFGNSLPTAYEYRWTSEHGTPPAETLEASATATAAIGDTQGDPSFALWQPGWLTDLSQADAANPGTNGDAQVFFRTTFAAASPNGRFAIAPVTMQALVSPRLAGPTPPPLDTHGLPILLAHDVAFAQILRRVSSLSGEAARPIIYIAWRPDGKSVATFNLDDDQRVNIYDCASGRLLRSVVEPPQSSVFSGILDALRWSPDGQRLLLLDGAVLTV